MYRIVGSWNCKTLACSLTSYYLRLVNQPIVTMAKCKPLDELNFVNGVLKNLPIDENKENYVRTVNNACFSLVKPTPVKNPRLVCYSEKALELLDLNESSIDEHFISCFAGNEIINGSETASHCYCGHQFGVFAGQLGDGAAIYLGEIINSKNEHWEVQLKGAGLTPYSRDADGRKVLRSSLREFLCSEAMHGLGIPTTRAATCIVAEDKVQRDMFYDGHPKMESCSVISRVAHSFIRFGSFEIFKPTDPNTYRSGPSVGRHDILLSLTDYVIKSLFPSIDSMDIPQTEKYKLFYKEVVIRTAKLAAKWQSVGFIHGVLNTDNMSVLGLTLDYGPFGFMDRFDPDHIPNTSDTDGRYRFRRQPEVCCWNLLKFAEALQPLVPLTELKEILSEHYFTLYNTEYVSVMMRKLGLFKSVDEDKEGLVSDEKLIAEWLQTLTKVGGDYTNCFRKLNLLYLPGLANFDENFEKLCEELIKQSSTLDEMMDHYQAYIASPMVQTQIILLQNFADKLKDDEKTIQIVSKLQHYKHLSELEPEQMKTEIKEAWDSWLKLYIERLNHEVAHIEEGNEDELKKLDEQRKKLMNENNPRYVLRNYLAEEAIQKAETDDISEAKRLLAALEDPFSERPEFDHYTQKPPKSACKLRVSCSS